MLRTLTQVSLPLAFQSHTPFALQNMKPHQLKRNIHETTAIYFWLTWELSLHQLEELHNAVVFMSKRNMKKYVRSKKSKSTGFHQWLFLVPLKGGRWHIIPQFQCCSNKCLHIPYYENNEFSSQGKIIVNHQPGFPLHFGVMACDISIINLVNGYKYILIYYIFI